jgi:anti-sigma factor RsiW
MSCRWREEEVAAFADDELDPAAQAEFAAHLSACRECPAALSERLELKRAVRLAGRFYAAPPELHAAVYRVLHPRASVNPWWKWTLAPLTLLLLGFIGFLLYPKPRADPVMARLVDQHVTNLATANPVDVISSDRHTVKPWYAGKLPFTFNLPELSGSSFQLVGGKVVYAEQQPGAQLWYLAGPHKISVFVFQTRNPNDKPLFNHDLSFNVNRWTQGGLVYYLVTDGSPDEAGKLVRMFQDANGV